MHQPKCVHIGDNHGLGEVAGVPRVVEEQVRVLIRLEIGDAEVEEAALIKSRHVQRALGE